MVFGWGNKLNKKVKVGETIDIEFRTPFKNRSSEDLKKLDSFITKKYDEEMVDVNYKTTTAYNKGFGVKPGRYLEYSINTKRKGKTNIEFLENDERYYTVHLEVEE